MHVTTSCVKHHKMYQTALQETSSTRSSLLDRLWKERWPAYHCFTSDILHNSGLLTSHSVNNWNYFWQHCCGNNLNTEDNKRIWLQKWRRQWHLPEELDMQARMLTSVLTYLEALSLPHCTFQASMDSLVIVMVVGAMGKGNMTMNQ